MTTHEHTALRRVAAYLRARMGAQGEVQRLAPFTVTFDPNSDVPARNYAMPDDGALAGRFAVSMLKDMFLRRRRTPRLEYIDELAPALLAQLQAQDFIIAPPLSLMTCARDQLVADCDLDGVAWTLAESEAELHAAATVQNHAYGFTHTSEADVERLHQVVDQGGAVALACCPEGSPLGAGLYTPPVDGVTEIAALGVASQARRRGIGRAMTALLADHAFVQGVECPFLMTEQANEDRVYRRAGFIRFGRLLTVSA
ncbi:GNAT family N-acetyltransferase [Dyella sp.]|uniref:GNAT family N-acetyltransferase n=1 Tax=Dyella sp. TaxID=1869338 RepID=UPI002ECFEAA1